MTAEIKKSSFYSAILSKWLFAKPVLLCMAVIKHIINVV